eukprot:scaffold188274_cov67-Cyclotella_meneghiniana.AAC.3
MSGRCAIIERAIRRASEPASLACAGSLCFDPAAKTTEQPWLYRARPTHWTNHDVAVAQASS